MSQDPFGNLEDWGRVLVTLKELTDQGRLDEAQEGIIRLVRYCDNWRLRESALVAAHQIMEPTPALLTAVAQVLEDQATYVDARILAARALGDLAGRKSRGGATPATSAKALRAVLQRQLDSPEAPVLTRAIEAALQKLPRTRVSA
jgi:hypothetical protein